MIREHAYAGTYLEKKHHCLYGGERRNDITIYTEESVLCYVRKQHIQPKLSLGNIAPDAYTPMNR